MNGEPEATTVKRKSGLVLLSLLFFTKGCSAAALLDKNIYAWRLYNDCSRGFVVPYERAAGMSARAIGDGSSDQCNSDFFVQSVGFGKVRIRHAETQRYLCYSSKKRIAMRLRVKEGDLHCVFTERLDNGYTMLESAAYPGIFLGFNSRGVFLTPTKIHVKRRCFNFLKYQRFITPADLSSCKYSAFSGYFAPSASEKEVMLTNLIRETFKKKFRATDNSLLLPNSSLDQAVIAT